MRWLLLVAFLLVAAACSASEASGGDGVSASTSSTTVTTTVPTASTTAGSTTSTTTVAPKSTTADATSTTDAPATTLPASTTEPVPTTTVSPATSAPPTTEPIEPAPMAAAGDLVGTLSTAEGEWAPGQPFTVMLTVTNVADHRVALEDPADLRFLAARVGDDALTFSFLWLGNTELDPGESHTMTRSWDPEIGPDPGDAITVTAVIAQSVDSFNRAQNTVGVVDGVPALVVPVTASA